MRKNDTLRLNTHALRERVEMLELKQWWLARETGVSTRTVNRWLTGEVKRIAIYNAEKLAEQLDCEVEEITVQDETEIYATRREQHAAAKLLQERDLLAILSPSDNWELAESLIRATMEPNLPLAQLGQLYNLLSIAAWRQGDYDQGLAHAQQALELGERTEETGIVYKAKSNIATIDSLRGDAGNARSIWEECVAKPEGYAEKADYAAALSNLGTIYREYAMFEESTAMQKKAIALYAELQRPFNLTIAWITETLLQIELGNAEGATQALAEIERYAKQSGFEKGLAQVLCYRADIELLGGDVEQAGQFVEQGIKELERFSVYDISCHEIEARVYRRCGEFKKAEKAIDEAIRRAVEVPVPFYQGMFLQEKGRLMLALGKEGDEAGLREKANEVFGKLGLERRIHTGTLTEYGRMFTEE